MVRFHRLLQRPAFDLAGLTFVRATPSMFFDPPAAAASGQVITIDAIQRVAAYVELTTAADAGFTTGRPSPDLAAIRAVVASVTTSSDADLARALGTDPARIAGLTPHLTLPARPFDRLTIVARCLKLADRLGVSGETLARMVDETAPAATFGQLARAAEDVLGAFRAKYPEAKNFAVKLEPYEDKLRARKRDGLVDYIVTRWPVFSSPDRLYEYFLVDVMMSGCARTSRIVAATSSVQLYVHRVLMNLERSADWNDAATPKVGVYARFTDLARRREWQWRRHYRVWEANRKVFLYPENYIEPELRDDKTPLFVELEDTLLVQEITTANVQDAYSRYLTGFDELARLKIAGAYYDTTAQTLHLFGVTQDDAPVYYYRAIDESGSTLALPIPPRFSAWHKLDLQIPVRRVSPFVFDGRLYVFWVETATRPVNTFALGTSHFGGYRHTVRIKYSTLRPDGAWSAPQVIRFAEGGGIADSRIVEDPRDTARVDAMKAKLKAKDDDRPGRDNAKVVAEEALRTATYTWALAVADQATKKAILEGPPNIGEVIAIGVLIGGGVPPHLALLIVRGAQHASWLAAVAAENRAVEARRIANDNLSTAVNRLAQLDKEIADLAAAIAAAQIHVRWDRSHRDHKDALDSYRPEGWAWDRVYPGIYNPPRPDLPAGTTGPAAIRLTFGPSGDHEPPPVGLPFGPGQFDAVSAVLREPTLPEAAAAQSAVRLNWASGKLQTLNRTVTQYPGQELVAAAYWLEQDDLSGSMVAVAPATAEVQVVGGYLDSVIVEAEGDAVWMRKAGTAYLGMRLGTSLTRTLARAFWRDGAASLLDSGFQDTLTEARSKISPIAGQSDPARQSPFHPEHPCLTYFRETFFHIPFVIADHLNTEQDFADAQRWYHYIFDPTAADGNPWRNRELREPDKLTTTLRELLVDDKALAAYRKDPFNPHAIARTRMSAYAKAIVMKYIDNLLDWADSLFAQFTMESVNEATMLYVMAQDILGPRPKVLGACHDSSSTSRTYRAIRPGLSSVSDFLIELETPPPVQVWRWVDDSTITLVMPVIESRAQKSMAATSPMMVAAAPAGPLAMPGTLGMPGTPDLTGITGLGGPAGTPVTVRELESGHGMYWTSTGGTALTTLRNDVTAGGTGLGTVLGTGTGSTPVIPPERGGATDFVRGYGPGSVGLRGGNVLTPVGDLASKHGIEELDLKYDLPDRGQRIDVDHDRHIGRFEYDPIDMVPAKDTVFCIPPNRDLLAYWDRVEDGLFKIRNCMDISGARRRLELFAPEIDPRLLVRMQAAGLTIDDVLAATSGDLPPYRFTYLIDKAKQHASTVQSFGAQLLAAIEKRDGEELNHLRAVHEQNLLQMRTKLTRLEIDAAEDTIEGLRAQKEAIEYRRQHFNALREVGSIPQERKQHALQREASQYRTAAGIAQVVASILTIIPDIGAPTSMKFGGSQLGAAGRAVGEGLGALAAFNDTAAAMAGIEAANKRRDEEWQHQAETARREIAQIEKNIAAAEIRRDIAVRSLEVHEQSVAQTEEMFEFFRAKFSSVERYRLLSKELRRLYRLAFNSALALAVMAERAYRSERTEDNELLVGNYWDAESAGLLAGERLLVDLQRLERQFVERNHRQLEIEHSFSLVQFAPDQLAELRLTGECTVEIPEWFFDLSYPGQLRRRIKAVRMSMPCVTGPYTNVGATLRLESSKIRLTVPSDPQQPLGQPTAVPQRQTVTIATSKAHYDAGVFDFSFRDERYMPFEGAGAISTWRIALPKTLRAFDYSTIGDVILHLNYTADHDERLAQRWDGAAALVALLAADLPDGTPHLSRMFSLRDEFPDVYHRLVTNPPNTEVGFAIDARHFSVFLAGHGLQARTASLAIVTPLDDLDGATVAFGRKATEPPNQFVTVAAPATATTGPGEQKGLRAFDCGSVFQAVPGGAGMTGALFGDYVVKLGSAGALASAAGVVDRRALHDIVLRVGYRLAPE